MDTAEVCISKWSFNFKRYFNDLIQILIKLLIFSEQSKKKNKCEMTFHGLKDIKNVYSLRLDIEGNSGTSLHSWHQSEATAVSKS